MAEIKSQYEIILYNSVTKSNLSLLIETVHNRSQAFVITAAIRVNCMSDKLTSSIAKAVFLV